MLQEEQCFPTFGPSDFPKKKDSQQDQTVVELKGSRINK
jgi:hypothetical protein